LVEAFVTSAESTGHPTHRGARGSSFARIAGYRAANRSERRASSGAFQYMGLRWLICLRCLAIPCCLRLARIESGLLNCPCVALIAIFILLSLALPFRGIDKDVLR
jgi:hypothetical protein